MGKYMRKRSVGRTPDVEHGVRTRARSAAVASKAAAAAVAATAAAPAPKRPRKPATARAEAEAAVRGSGGGAAPAGCCYLQLRSRRLFMPAGDVQCPVPPLPAAAVQRSVASGEPVEVAGTSSSGCSSTASSVDVVLAVAPAATERSGREAEEPREDCDVESVVSDSAGCRGRERRETTPSSRPPVDLSDEECSQATDDDTRSATVVGWLWPPRQRPRWLAEGARMPPAGEIEEFFGVAEKAQAERFAAKYNFDVARGLPLAAGRYEWTPVASG